MSAGGLDWSGLLRAGLVTLRLRPAEFWALSPAELGAMLDLAARPVPMGRRRFLALARAHPDKDPGP